MTRPWLRFVVYPVAGVAAVWLCVAWWGARRDRQVADALEGAWNAVAAGDYGAAASAGQTAVALRPSDPRAWWALGVALSGRARLERGAGRNDAAVASETAARDAIDRACDDAAGDRALRVDIVASLLRVPAIDLTLHACERVLADGPDADALRFRALARLAAARGTGTAPSAAVRAAVEADCAAALAAAVAAGDGAAAARVGLSAAECAAADVVAQAAVHVQALDAGDPVGAFLAAWGAEQRSAPDEADAALSQAIDLLGVRERAVAVPSTALLDQWRALALECYGRRGRIRLGAGQAREAVLDLSRALQIEPRWAEANHLLARAFVQVGEPAAAAAALGRAAAFGSSARRKRIREEVAAGDWDDLPETVRSPLLAGMVPAHNQASSQSDGQE